MKDVKMKLNKRTQDLLNAFEYAVVGLEREAHEGISNEAMQKAQALNNCCEKELNRHLFKLEERLRKFKKANKC